MKIALVFIALILVLLTGCAALNPPIINTAGNTFSSSKNPSIQIKLNEEFQYLGRYDNKFEAGTTGYTGQTIKTMNVSYLYPQLSNDNYLKKMIGISILELPSGRNWHPNTMLVVKNPLKESIVKLGGKNFQYCIKAKQAVSRATQKYLLDNGISTPRCYMWMLIGRVFGSNLKVYISYYEDIKNFKGVGADTCFDWKNNKMLTETQKEYIKEFEKRALNSIEILEN